jgi:streptogramin lyase
MPNRTALSLVCRLAVALVLAALFAPAASAAARCTAGKMLVSAYFTNVFVYDACSGAFLRTLDDQNRIHGAMATQARPDGKLYVVSEETGKILRYDATTLDFVDIFIDTGAAFHPTSLAFAPNGDLYIGGFNADEVRRYDGRTGALLGTPVPAHTAGLDGPDNGMSFGSDGKLYIPSFNSNSVVRYDPATGSTSTFIPSGSGGLRHTRAVLFEPGGNTMLVSSEGTGQVLRYNTVTGTFLGVFANPGSALGLAYTNDNRLLVAGDGDIVSVVEATSGRLLGTLPPAGEAHGLANSVYVSVLTSNADLSQIGSQYWIVGAGKVSGRSIAIDMVSATGTVFGSEFNPADVVRKRWGSVRIDFTGCTAANYSWESTGDNSARFGSGGYPLQLLVATAFTDQCQRDGFSQTSTSHFMNGTWFGGEPRSGEGLLITVDASGTAFVALFTHTPPGI